MAIHHKIHVFWKERLNTCRYVCNTSRIHVFPSPIKNPLEYADNTAEIHVFPSPSENTLKYLPNRVHGGTGEYGPPLALPRGRPVHCLGPSCHILEPLCQGLVLLIRRVSCLLLPNQCRPHSFVEAALLTWAAQLLQLVFQIYLVQDVVDSNNM